MNELINWWQHIPEHIDPVILAVGPIKLQYYGLMYLVAFGFTLLMALLRIRTEKRFSMSTDQVKDITTIMLLGVILGGRLGYVLFYNPGYYLQHPLEIFLPFEFSDGIRFTGITGMSYHGGLIGAILGAFLYIRKAELNFRECADLFLPVIPLGYTFGRIGNFINGELYGRITTAPIGMYFPGAPGQALRHPSQLYEAVFEGIFLFIVLWSLRKRKLPQGSMLGLYLIGYGTVRFVIEFFRQPDAHLGFVAFSFSMGQILCFLMIAAGLILLSLFKKMDRT